MMFIEIIICLMIAPLGAECIYSPYTKYLTEREEVGNFLANF